jgi:hypothetical protein
MTLIFAILATLWWISIWGLFEIITKEYSDEQKVKVYLIILGIVFVILCFFPKVINHL